MREADTNKKVYKAAKTISFDRDVLLKLEMLCKRDNTTPSNFVNLLVRKAIMDNKEYYLAKAKYHCAQMNTYKMMADGDQL